jgi:hypothetical protein
MSAIMKAKFTIETHIEVSDFWKRVRLDISPDQLLALEDWHTLYGAYILGVIKRSRQEPILVMLSPTPGFRIVVPIEIIAEDLDPTSLGLSLWIFCNNSGQESG